MISDHNGTSLDDDETTDHAINDIIDDIVTPPIHRPLRLAIDRIT
jgi:hypothetical protein